MSSTRDSILLRRVPLSVEHQIMIASYLQHEQHVQVSFPSGLWNTEEIGVGRARSCDQLKAFGNPLAVVGMKESRARRVKPKQKGVGVLVTYARWHSTRPRTHAVNRRQSFHFTGIKIVWSGSLFERMPLALAGLKEERFNKQIRSANDDRSSTTSNYVVDLDKSVTK